MSPFASEQQFEHVDTLLNKLRIAVEQGKLKRIRHLTCQYLNSFDAKCVAVERAYKKIELHRRPDASELKNIAQRLDPWKGSPEEVIVHYKPKRSNPDDF